MSCSLKSFGRVGIASALLVFATVIGVSTSIARASTGYHVYIVISAPANSDYVIGDQLWLNVSEPPPALTTANLGGNNNGIDCMLDEGNRAAR